MPPLKKNTISAFSSISFLAFFWFFCRNTQIIKFIKTRKDFRMHESNFDLVNIFYDRWKIRGKPTLKYPTLKIPLKISK
jgi:hypothetical protein